MYHSTRAQIYTFSFKHINRQTYNIRDHKDYFTWAEFFVLLFVYVGRFLNIESLENIFTYSVLGKNPEPIKDQCMQNSIAYWAPKFMVDSFNEFSIQTRTTQK